MGARFFRGLISWRERVSNARRCVRFKVKLGKVKVKYRCSDR
jgi:hypothetical protein